ncbi:MAG TPA: hypothetical protein VN672_08455 [Solirubrobacteraceae bacterium]|nr:hypothetical protein [Solirubrobacteraceae bacterium]
MRRIKIAGLCLLAVCAVSVTMSATASAANPEYGRCLKAATKALTNYDSAKCIKFASEDAGTEAEKLKKGNYQWTKEILKKKLTGTLKEGTFATLENKSGTKVTCSKLKSSGEITGLTTEVATEVVFSECESGGIKCNTEGDGVGVIKVKELEGELGVITKVSPSTKDKIGNVLWPKGGTPTSGSKFVFFACAAALTADVHNSVISPVTSNAMKLEQVVKYTGSKGVQKPTKFEGGPNMFLETSFTGAPLEPSSQVATTIVKAEEKIEIRST